MGVVRTGAQTMTRTADTRRGEPGWREHRAGRGATDPSRQGRRGRGTGVPEPAGSYSGSQGAAWRGRWLRPGRPRSSRGSSRVNLEKLMSPRSYPRSSNDSKMSVSMRSHSMLLWYSNFRVVRLPSRRQRVHSRMRSFPGTSKSTAGASVAALRMFRACASSLVPPTAPPPPLKMTGNAHAHYKIVTLFALRRAGRLAAWQLGSRTQPGGAELLECACAQLWARRTGAGGA